MNMESAIETSGDISVEWLCKLWGYRTALEMHDMLHGFRMITAKNLDWEVCEEIMFLKDICWEKRGIEWEELGEAA